MLISVEIKNIGAYDYAKLTFSTGKTIIHGANGSGKTTLIRAIIFGIFGDFNLLPEIEPFELIKTGKMTGSIQIVFTDPQRVQTISIERTVELRAQSVSQTVTMSVGGHTYSGVEAVKREVQNILGIDSRLFINTVVGFQGEISAIVKRKTSQEMFDRMFGIRDFDTAWNEFRPIIKELETEQNTIEEQIAYLENDMKNADGTREEYARALKETQDLREEMSLLNYPTVKIPIDQMRYELVNLSQTLERLVQTRTETETFLKAKNEQIEATGRQVCPTCETTLTPEYRKQLTTRFRREAKDLEKNITDMGTRITTLQEDLSNRGKSITEAQEQIAANREVFSGIQTKLDVYEQTVIPSLEKRVADSDTLIQRINGAKANLTTFKDSIKFAKLIREAFRDVRPILWQGRIASMEDATNAIFRDLFGLDIGIAISPEYIIEINEEAANRSTRTLSGGESVNLGLALRLAIVKSIGGQDVLILDEPTESMDDFRKERLLEVLDNLQTDVQILVVTHSSVLIAAADHLIRVEKERGMSHVDQVT